MQARDVVTRDVVTAGPHTSAHPAVVGVGVGVPAPPGGADPGPAGRRRRTGEPAGTRPLHARTAVVPTDDPASAR